MNVKRISTLLIFPLLIAGCGSAGSTPSRGTSTASIDAQPQALAFSGQIGQQATVMVSGGTAPYAVKVADPRLVSVSLSPASGNTTSFTVVPVAGGGTTIAVSDSGGGSTSISVNTQVCEPPAPDTILSYPPSGASDVSSNLRDLWVAVPSSDPGLSNLGAFSVRLIGSDGSNALGTDLSVTGSPPPSGSYSPPSTGSAPGGGTYTYTYDYATSAVANLGVGLAYQVQLMNIAYPCMPPEILGEFST